MIYVRVAPNARLPMNRDELTYTVRAEDVSMICVGRLVRVRVHGQKTWGVITAMSRTKPKDVQRFSDIEKTLPVTLPESIVLLAQKLRNDLWHPLGICIAAMLPPIASRYPKQPNTEAISEKKHGAKTFAVTGAPSDRWKQYQQLLAKATKAKQSVILVFAQRALLESFLDTCTFPVVRWDADVKTSQRWKQWLAVQTNPVIVAGLRTAAFAPAKQLGMIIVDCPNGRGQKSDQAPYYSTLDIVQARKEIEDCTVILGDVLPPFSSTKISAIRSPATYAPVSLIAKDSTPAILRSQSEAWIREYADERHRLFILINRVGSGWYRCQTCHEAIPCVRCGRIPIAERNMLHCLSCGWRGAVPNACPHCRSVNISPRGVGTESIVKAVRQLTDSSVLVIDRNTVGYPNTNASIIVGTEFALPYLAQNAPTHSLIIGIDELRARSSLDANEHAIRLIADVAANTSGELAIETSSPEDEWFLQVKRHEFSELLQQEAFDRKQFDYPPFGKLIQFRSKELAPLTSIAKELRAINVQLFNPTEVARDRSFRMIAKLSLKTRLDRLLEPLDEKKLFKQVTVEANPLTESFD